MRAITFKPKKGQNPETTITLPTGQECKFQAGKYTTADPGTVEWLNRLGYQPYRKPGRPRKNSGR